MNCIRFWSVLDRSASVCFGGALTLIAALLIDPVIAADEQEQTVERTGSISPDPCSVAPRL